MLLFETEKEQRINFIDIQLLDRTCLFGLITKHQKILPLKINNTKEGTKYPFNHLGGVDPRLCFLKYLMVLQYYDYSDLSQGTTVACHFDIFYDFSPTLSTI